MMDCSSAVKKYEILALITIGMELEKKLSQVNKTLKIL